MNHFLTTLGSSIELIGEDVVQLSASMAGSPGFWNEVIALYNERTLAAILDWEKELSVSVPAWQVNLLRHSAADLQARQLVVVTSQILARGIRP